MISRLQGSQLAALQTLAQTVQQWSEPIAAMWRFSKNNAITEGFHRKMKLIQRRAYGFRNFHNYRLRVIAQCG
jgi:transposase